MRQRSGFAAALVGLALAGTSAAAPAPAPATEPTAVEEVTVMTRRARDKLVQSFIRDYTTLSPSGQITRWRHPICPHTLGLTEAANAMVTKRVREIAVMAGAPVRAEDSCSINLLVVFTLKPQALLDGIRKQAPEALGFHYFHDRAKVSRVKHPIQAWYATETEDNNGYTVTDSDEPQGVVAVTGSRISPGLASGLVTALVVVDAKALNGFRAVDGFEVGPLADYVAMMALSQTQSPDKCKATATIANLMSVNCPAERKPAGITEADLAYLRALYWTSPTLLADSQRNQIAFRMKQILDGGR